MRSKRIELRITADERKIIVDQAGFLGVSISDYVRSTACGRKVRRADELKTLICWMGRVCGNLHALAKYANFNKGQANSVLILASLLRIEAEIDEVRKTLC